MMIPIPDKRSRAYVETSMLLERHAAHWLLVRYHDGMLSDELLRDMARDVLFTPLDQFKRRGVLRPARHPHADGCTSRDIAYRSKHQLTESEAALKMLADIEAARTTLLAPSSLEVVLHEGRCRVCSSEIKSFGALVTVHFAGLELSREYALDA